MFVVFRVSKLTSQQIFKNIVFFLNFHFQVAVVGFVAADDADFNAAGDMFDDVPFGVLDADAAKALDVAEGKIALLKQVKYNPHAVGVRHFQ